MVRDRRRPVAGEARIATVRYLQDAPIARPWHLSELPGFARGTAWPATVTRRRPAATLFAGLGYRPRHLSQLAGSSVGYHPRRRGHGNQAEADLCVLTSQIVRPRRGRPRRAWPAAKEPSRPISSATTCPVPGRGWPCSLRTPADVARGRPVSSPTHAASPGEDPMQLQVTAGDGHAAAPARGYGSSACRDTGGPVRAVTPALSFADATPAHSARPCRRCTWTPCDACHCSTRPPATRPHALPGTSSPAVRESRPRGAPGGRGSRL